MAFALSAPVGCEPLSDFAPDQAPEAVHAEALVDDQLKVALPPLVIELGLALKRTLGEAALTETVADWVALPPAPVQVRLKVELAVSAPVDCEPLTDLAPVQAPDAAQAVAFAETQVNVALAPLAIALGPTLNCTVGVGDLTDTVVAWVAEPPGPVHVKV